VEYSDVFASSWPGFSPLDPKFIVHENIRDLYNKTEEQDVDTSSLFSLEFVRIFSGPAGSVYLLGAFLRGAAGDYQGQFSLYRFTGDFKLERTCVFTTK
jgi:hypothetical protein